MLRSPNQIMTRELSCGVIARRSRGELLLCHATGRNYWDIPKGLADPDEDPRAAALRELREETASRSSLCSCVISACIYLPRSDPPVRRRSTDPRST
jgi:8-oxo-dGTP pyrophosphatase MutT (NUDIX family)